MEAETLRLVVALADTGNRFLAAQRLAEHARADALLVLVEDDMVKALVPAVGFPTLCGGPGWRALLAASRQPGIYDGEVLFPTADTSTPALAFAGAGVVLVFLGDGTDRAMVDQLRVVMPLLAAALLAEQAAIAAQGEMRFALKNAREAAALAVALDAARSEVERTLRALEDRSRALDHARARAEQAVRAKDEFLAMLGHELRNPLSPMMTAVQLLRLKGQVGREHEIIERQLVNLTRLVDDLLDVSRLTSGKITLRREIIEVADAAARAIEMVSPLLEQKRQTLTVDVPPHGLLVDADPTRLSQVLANLLTNAAKYSDDETRITIAAFREDASIRVRVKDQGIGIPPEMIDRVFDLFEQHQQAIDRSQGGLGLGLAIARSLVTLHGGSIRVVSAGLGTGAEFIVDLPPAARTPLVPIETRRANDAGPTGRGRRVLVVDDNRDALMMLAEALGRLGFDAQTARDGPTAIEAAAQLRPHLAILDIGLPVMDGYELAGRLRALAGLASLKLVAVTGYGQQADRLRSEKAGFDAHLIKPVSLDELERVLADLSAELPDGERTP